MKRTVRQALDRAEKLRKELPSIAQVNASDWDLILLADHITLLYKLCDWKENFDNSFIELDSKNQPI